MKTKKTRKSTSSFGLLTIAVAIIVIAIAFIAVKKYAPSNERMSLNDYFKVKGDNMAVIVDGEYDDVEGEEAPAKLINSSVYLNIDFLKSKLDDGYVYDNVEKVLRYTTNKNVISVKTDSKDYTIDKENKSFEKPIIKEINGIGFISIEWAKKYTDMQYTTQKNPNRVIIEHAGWKKDVAILKKNVAIRRFGGVKSKILGDGKKGESVVVSENYGKWSKIVSPDGIIGCVQNSALRDITSNSTKSTLDKREFKHKKFGKKITLGWMQMTNQSANTQAMKKLDDLSMVNVVSPTWFYIADSNGNVGNRSSREFVNYAHSKGMQVWGLISNFEDKSIDTQTALNRTSSRDNLVDQTIAAAISSGVDGINVDFESISASEKDGYLEFIRELSLKCEKNDLILSVDNYVPTEYTSFYDRDTQADFADYIIVMAYDEHFAGSKKAGSVSSYPFVKNGIEDTLKEVPKEQLVLGLPFFTRIWCTENGTVSSTAVGIKDQYDKFGKSGGEAKWLDKECQNYAEYKDGDKLYQCWFEDSKSLGKKLSLVNQKKLAGAAFWKVGLEGYDTWNTVMNYMTDK